MGEQAHPPRAAASGGLLKIALISVIVTGLAGGCTPGAGCLHDDVIRILSDLHLYDARTRVRDLRQLEPLLAGVRTLVLNGDCCEMRRGATPSQVAGLQAFFRARVPEVVFVTGNHDPDISDVHELSLAGGQVWVTHGDVCFDDITPWARSVDELRERVAAKRAANPAEDFTQLPVRFRILREVTREEHWYQDRTTRNWRAHLAWFWSTFFPPRQPLAMLRCWRELPRLAARLAAAQRPAARVIVTGHIHFPGVWHRADGPVVVNTGAFMPPLGANLVDVFDDRVEVRRIAREGTAFKPGRLIAELALGGTRAATGARPGI